jgi:predicted small secreted protein
MRRITLAGILVCGMGLAGCNTTSDGGYDWENLFKGLEKLGNIYSPPSVPLGPPGKMIPMLRNSDGNPAGTPPIKRRCNPNEGYVCK